MPSPRVFGTAERARVGNLDVSLGNAARPASDHRPRSPRVICFTARSRLACL